MSVFAPLNNGASSSGGDGVVASPEGRGFERVSFDRKTLSSERRTIWGDGKSSSGEDTLTDKAAASSATTVKDGRWPQRIYDSGSFSSASGGRSPPPGGGGGTTTAKCPSLGATGSSLSAVQICEIKSDEKTTKVRRDVIATKGFDKRGLIDSNDDSDEERVQLSELHEIGKCERWFQYGEALTEGSPNDPPVSSAAPAMQDDRSNSTSSTKPKGLLMPPRNDTVAIRRLANQNEDVRMHNSQLKNKVSDLEAEVSRLLKVVSENEYERSVKLALVSELTLDNKDKRLKIKALERDVQETNHQFQEDMENQLREKDDKIRKMQIINEEQEKMIVDLRADLATSRTVTMSDASQIQNPEITENFATEDNFDQHRNVALLQAKNDEIDQLKKSNEASERAIQQLKSDLVQMQMKLKSETYRSQRQLKVLEDENAMKSIKVAAFERELRGTNFQNRWIASWMKDEDSKEEEVVESSSSTKDEKGTFFLQSNEDELPLAGIDEKSMVVRKDSLDENGVQLDAHSHGNEVYDLEWWMRRSRITDVTSCNDDDNDDYRIVFASAN